MLDYEYAKNIVEKYINSKIEECRSLDISKEDIDKRINMINSKLIHTMEVVNDINMITPSLECINKYDGQEFASTAGLLHDIGRFEQISRFGSNNDELFIGSNLYASDHGELGRLILLDEDLISKIIPKTEKYNIGLGAIVGYHAKSELPKFLNYKLEDDYNYFKTHTVSDILDSSHLIKKNMLLSLIIQLVQDVDRLDIYHQIISDRWTPLMTEDNISDQVFTLFYNKNLPSMKDLKERNLWNPNVGELVRLSFIYKLKLVSVARLIQKDNMILKMRDKRQNTKVKEAFDVINDYLEYIINNSYDGIYLNQKVKIKR